MHLFELQFLCFPDICPGVGLLAHMVTLSFLRNFELFSIMAALVYIPKNILGGFPFLHTLSIFIICRFSDDSDFDLSEVITH